jgi:hypothetical protein
LEKEKEKKQKKERNNQPTYALCRLFLWGHWIRNSKFLLSAFLFYFIFILKRLYGSHAHNHRGRAGDGRKVLPPDKKKKEKKGKEEN